MTSASLRPYQSFQYLLSRSNGKSAPVADGTTLFYKLSTCCSCFTLRPRFNNLSHLGKKHAKRRIHHSMMRTWHCSNRTIKHCSCFNHNIGKSWVLSVDRHTAFSERSHNVVFQMTTRSSTKLESTSRIGVAFL